MPKSVKFLALASSLALLAGCGSSSSPTAGGAPGMAGGGRGGPQGPRTVGVIVIAPKPTSLSTELPGRTVPYRIAEVRPQISGIIQKRLFEEGANVKAGQPLYQIDPGVYRATRDSAQASVSKADANLMTARLKYDRYQKLASAGMVSQQDKDDVTATLRQAEADLATAKAALQAADINLDYTRIVAPISGRIATSAYTEGALVTANQTNTLTTVQQLDPIYVDLSQPNAELQRFRAQIEAGTLRRRGGSPANVQLRLDDGRLYPLKGTLQFVGATVSSDTGAVTLRAVMPNPNGQLLPGMYVRAIVNLGVDERAILAPQSAVSRNETGDPVALVVEADGKVAQRILKTSQVVGTDWLVTDGLKAGDRLIVEGSQKVRIGDVARVEIIDPAATAASAAAATTPTPAASAH